MRPDGPGRSGDDIFVIRDGVAPVSLELNHGGSPIGAGPQSDGLSYPAKSLSGLRDVEPRLRESCFALRRLVRIRLRALDFLVTPSTGWSIRVALTRMFSRCFAS